MKGLRLFFAVCLVPLVFGGAYATDTADTARAAARRGAQTNTQPVSRAKGTSDRVSESTPQTPTTAQTGFSRSTTAVTSGNTVARDRTTSTRGTSSESVVERQSSQSAPSVTARKSVPSVSTRQPITTPQTAKRGTITSRIAQPVQTTSRTSSPQTAPRSANTRRATPTRLQIPSRNIARATTESDTTPINPTVLSKNYKKCREVYASCMDEFCANKDANLGRCACSTRLHEFDKVKKNLAQVEDKMLTFNQRLLTVNMDKEDAAALYQATEGEIAFNQKDTSTSKKMLDEIAKKLNTSFDDSHFNRNLNAISLSLDMDAAFDSVDSLRGANTTAKTGTDLYAAALPVCRETALEVCSQEELDIAESGYQMTIEQDCNTVFKSYQAKTDQARETVREGSALLDMSRLNAYQTRNSDDLLTCKTKMLDMLTDSTVCGSDMGKCLDVTGQYIDPSTGQAFLTQNLTNIRTLITRPTGDETWTGAAGNDVFVSFLYNKKKYLAPAMENCQDIADTVWKAFIEDALSQIKIAQERKLEDMRQSCTTLTTQCLTDTAKTLADFDARALSTFGVHADKTVAAMCSEITNACSALLNSAPDTDSTGPNQWTTGMTEIADMETYNTILKTCREVGRACIVQACTSISGNFGLCENIQTSVNRHSILTRDVCWNQVVQCVRDAGDDKITSIMNQLTAEGIYNNNFYDTVYGASNLNLSQKDAKACIYMDTTSKPGKKRELPCIYDFCSADYCDQTKNTILDCYSCRIAEQIWGNCEVQPDTPLAPNPEKSVTPHNQILIPSQIAIDDASKKDNSTLLSWFAQNTGTMFAPDSCRVSLCPAGQTFGCTGTGAAKYCQCTTSPTDSCQTICSDGMYTVNDGLTNCCSQPTNNTNGFCPAGNYSNITNFSEPMFQHTIINDNVYKVFTPNATNTLVATWTSNATAGNYPAGTYALFCNGSLTGENATTNFPSGDTLKCSGTFILVKLDTNSTDKDKNLYFEPTQSTEKQNSINTFQSGSPCSTCYYDVATQQWSCGTTPNRWKINLNP